MDIENPYAAAMKKVLTGEGKSFVVFEYGTVVVVVNASTELDLTDHAIQLLGEHGAVAAGGPAGDFGVINLPNEIGWAVTCHHPDILSIVLPNELTKDASELSIGLRGRGKRGDDSVELRVVHVEDGRAKTN